MPDSFAGMSHDQKFALLRKELTAIEQRIARIATDVQGMKEHIGLIEKRLGKAAE